VHGKLKAGKKYNLLQFMSSRPSITVIGSCVIDVTIYCSQLPLPGESLVASHVETRVGGKGINQAIATVRLGARAELVTRLGNDDWGRLAHRTCNSEGVGLDSVVFDPEDATGIGVIVVAESGENFTVSDPGASDRLSFRDVERASHAIGDSAVLTVHLNAPMEVVNFALELGKQSGCTNILNVSPFADLPRSTFELADVLVMNQLEASQLIGANVSDPMTAGKAAQLIRDMGANAVVISLGKFGVVLAHSGGEHLLKARATNVKDIAGAGDALVAGIATALTEGCDLVAATEFGCAVATLSVSRPGTWQAIPDRASIELLIGNRYMDEGLTS
jgi:ribokinase